MSLINLKYFDEQSGQWAMRRPSVTTSLSNRQFSAVAINLGIASTLPSQDRASRLGSVVSTTGATFCMLLEVSQPFYESLLQEPWVRSHYGICDLLTFVGNTITPVEGNRSPKAVEIEHGCLILVRRGVNVDYVESLGRQFSSRDRPPQPIVALHMRQFIGSGSQTICAMHVDPTATLDYRSNYVNDVIERLCDMDNVLVMSNFYQTPTSPTMVNKDFRASVLWGKKRAEVHDVLDSIQGSPAARTLGNLESSVWWRSRRGMITLDEVGPVSSDPASGSNVYQSGVYMKYVSNNHDVSPPGTPPPALPSQFVDPAIMSVRREAPAPPAPRSAGVGMGSPGTNEGMNLASILSQQTAGRQGSPGMMAQTTGPSKPLSKWSVSLMIALKRNSALTPEEAAYDLTSKFDSVSEAVDKLNSGAFVWPSDYAIVHNTLLASNQVACGYSDFKNYVASRPSPKQMMTGPTSPQGPGAGKPGDVGVVRRSQQLPPVDGQSVGSPASAASYSSPQQMVRRREWSESKCTLVYQVTPREMYLDITQHVGTSRGNLRLAVDRLNQGNGYGRRMPDTAGKPENKLADYRYDYALLYCPDRAAYWLLSCKDVPCDIHACRQQCAPSTPQAL